MDLKQFSPIRSEWQGFSLTGFECIYLASIFLNSILRMQFKLFFQLWIYFINFTFMFYKDNDVPETVDVNRAVGSLYQVAIGCQIILNYYFSFMAVFQSIHLLSNCYDIIFHELNRILTRIFIQEFTIHNSISLLQKCSSFQSYYRQQNNNNNKNNGGFLKL